MHFYCTPPHIKVTTLSKALSKPYFNDKNLLKFQAKYDASELITQRDAVSNNVADELTRRAETFGIYLDDISITHLTFGSDFARAVESKQVAQQEAERSRYFVEKVCK